MDERSARLRFDFARVITTKGKTDSGRISSNHRLQPVGYAGCESLAQIEPTQFHREFSATDRDHLQRDSNVPPQNFAGLPGTLLRGCTSLFRFKHSGRGLSKWKKLSSRN